MIGIDEVTEIRGRINVSYSQGVIVETKVIV